MTVQAFSESITWQIVDRVREASDLFNARHAGIYSEACADFTYYLLTSREFVCRAHILKNLRDIANGLSLVCGEEGGELAAEFYYLTDEITVGVQASLDNGDLTVTTETTTQ